MLKKRLGPRLSCRFLGYAGNCRNLIGWFRKLKNIDFSRKIKTADWCMGNQNVEMLVVNLYNCAVVFIKKIAIENQSFFIITFIRINVLTYLKCYLLYMKMMCVCVWYGLALSAYLKYQEKYFLLSTYILPKIFSFLSDFYRNYLYVFCFVFSSYFELFYTFLWSQLWFCCCCCCWYSFFFVLNKNKIVIIFIWSDLPNRFVLFLEKINFSCIFIISDALQSVSYTHLTLPTILLV